VTHIVADGHAGPAAPTDDETLEKGRAFAGWALAALGPVCLGVFPKASQVGLVLFPAYISRMGSQDDCVPLLARQQVARFFSAGKLSSPAAPIDEGARSVRARSGQVRLGSANRWLGRLQRAGETWVPTQSDSAFVIRRPRSRVHAGSAPQFRRFFKRWLLGTHQGAVRPDQLDRYLDEFTFRFNRRSSRSRGLLFYRLLEQAVIASPAPYRFIVGGKP
jgi:hypothetical protein